MRLVTAAVISLSLWGCQPDGSSDVGTNPTTAPTTGVNATGVAVLGSGSHSASNVNMEVITGNGDKIREPTDLGFHPDNSGELWVVNQSTESVTILFEAGDETQESSHRQELVSGPHFLARPAGIAFGRNTMATIHDTDEPTVIALQQRNGLHQAWAPRTALHRHRPTVPTREILKHIKSRTKTSVFTQYCGRYGQ